MVGGEKNDKWSITLKLRVQDSCDMCGCANNKFNFTCGWSWTCVWI